MKVTLTRCGLTVYAGYYFLKMNRRGAVTRDTRHTLYTRVEEDDEIALCPRPTALLYLRYTGPHISHTLCRATRHRAPLPLARFRHARAPARAEHTQSSCVRSPDRAEQCALGAQDSRGTGDGHASTTAHATREHAGHGTPPPLPTCKASWQPWLRGAHTPPRAPALPVTRHRRQVHHAALPRSQAPPARARRRRHRRRRHRRRRHRRRRHRRYCPHKPTSSSLPYLRHPLSAPPSSLRPPPHSTPPPHSSLPPPSPPPSPLPTLPHSHRLHRHPQRRCPGHHRRLASSHAGSAFRC